MATGGPEKEQDMSDKVRHYADGGTGRVGFVIGAHDRVVSPTLQGVLAPADERHANHSLVRSRGYVVLTLRGGLIHPQSGPRRPVKPRESFAIRVCQRG